MRIEIIKGLVLRAKSNSHNHFEDILFPAGEYTANMTSDGKIEVLNKGSYKAQFSFSQFREKISVGDFFLIET